MRAFKSAQRRRDRTELMQRLATSPRPEHERAYFRILDRFGRNVQQLELYEGGYLDIGGEG